MKNNLQPGEIVHLNHERFVCGGASNYDPIIPIHILDSETSQYIDTICAHTSEISLIVFLETILIVDVKHTKVFLIIQDRMPLVGWILNEFFS